MSKLRRDRVIDNDQAYMLDKILRDGVLVGLSPLSEYLDSHNLKQYFSVLPFSFGDMRGYQCGWEIIDKKLYLVSFESRSQRLNKTAQLIGEMPIDTYTEKMAINVEMKRAMRVLDVHTRKKVGLKNSERKQIAELLDNLYDIVMQKKPLPQDDERDEYIFPEDTTHLFAEWFSGELVLYQREPQNDEDINGWHYVIENGIIVDKIPMHVRRPRI